MKLSASELVPWPVRLVAAAVDLGCVGVLAGWVATAIPLSSGAGFVGIGAAYYLGCDWRFGRTLGKLLCGFSLRVARSSNAVPGRGRLVLRSALRLLGPLGLLSWRRRTLLDRLTGVVAVATEPTERKPMRIGDGLGGRGRNRPQIKTIILPTRR